MKFIVRNIKKKILNGSERTIRTKKNIYLSIGLKGLSIGISLLLVPLTLNYLNQTEYGIWLTLSSIIGWISFFDFGLGNGFRNKFAEAIAKGDIELAKIYTSTTFALVSILIGIIYMLFIIINPFLNWSKILNTELIYSNNLNLLVFIVFTFFCLQFIFKIINTLLIADQKPAQSDLINVIGSLISLIFIFILTKFTHGSLLFVGTVFSIAPVLVLIITSIFLFRNKYKEFRPTINKVNFKYSNDLLGLGVKFFILQITSLIVFTTSNLIISQLFGPKEVTPFNIAFKYFSILTMTFSIIITPFWSAYTEAFFKNDYIWIKRSINKQIMIWLLFCIFTFIMIIFSNSIYELWVGKEIHIPIRLSIMIGIYTIVFNWNNIFTFFLNGTGKIKLQLILAILSSIVMIPLAYFLGKKFGIFGIISSMCISLGFGALGTPIQYYKIINKKANGIWNN